MACVENTVHIDSEREEGEIVDDLDDLSDISSEEEYLLRQRLYVLEKYNHVLERKEAKRSTFVDTGCQHWEDGLPSISEKPFRNLQENTPHYISSKQPIVHKSNYKLKKRRNQEQLVIPKKKEFKKKAYHIKRKSGLCESSEESDDDFKNKIRKLAHEVADKKPRNDTSTLSDRLKKMMHPTEQVHVFTFPVIKKKKNVIHDTNIASETEIMVIDDESDKGIDLVDSSITVETKDKPSSQLTSKSNDNELVNDLNTYLVDSDSNEMNLNINNEINTENKDSDEDLELLRQHALNTKSGKSNICASLPTICEDEDSDTTELRQICLRSALLKKAIELKRKQKLKKRLSQSSNNVDFDELEEIPDAFDNNTDIESVDMEMGSDADEKGKENSNKIIEYNNINENNLHIEIARVLNEDVKSNDDEIDDDEDLLRAKLLTSLSRNLPKFTDPDLVNEDEKPLKSSSLPIKTQEPEKRFIINLNESDSETEHEATKNLKKMHLKLSEQKDFQTKLDMFLKSARDDVEKKVPSPNIKQNTIAPKPSPKFVPKAVKHLPKSEQLEYKNLVKRMAELEKMKQARQVSLNTAINNNNINKDTLKPRNVSINTSKITSNKELENQIAASRKTIAEVSAKMLQLKEQSKNLSQKYKIVATELKNISTAIVLNKKEQRAAQMKLSKARTHHQVLLKSNHQIPSQNHVISNKTINKLTTTAKPQKENDPTNEDFNKMLKSVKVCIVNDLKPEVNPRLSIQVDVANNVKTVAPMITEDNQIDNKFDTIKKSGERIVSFERSIVSKDSPIDKGGGVKEHFVQEKSHKNKSSRLDKLINPCDGNEDDYKSPLGDFKTRTWVADPNGFLCPFEVAGQCKDPDCQHIHSKNPTQQ